MLVFKHDRNLHTIHILASAPEAGFNKKLSAKKYKWWPLTNNFKEHHRFDEKSGPNDKNGKDQNAVKDSL